VVPLAADGPLASNEKWITHRTSLQIAHIKLLQSYHSRSIVLPVRCS
jgi:hypothetical protein